jgi:hypothetical protein
VRASGFGLRASGCRIRGRIFLDEAGEVLHIFYWGFGEDAVAEIEDVAGASGGELQNLLGARFQFFPVRE